MRINTHAFETEEQIKSLNNKIAQNEKTGSNFEKVLDEWKLKAEDFALELEAVRSEAAKEDSIDQLNISGMVSVKY